MREKGQYLAPCPKTQNHVVAKVNGHVACYSKCGPWSSSSPHTGSLVGIENLRPQVGPDESEPALEQASHGAGSYTHQSLRSIGLIQTPHSTNEETEARGGEENGPSSSVREAVNTAQNEPETVVWHPLRSAGVPTPGHMSLCPLRGRLPSLRPFSRKVGVSQHPSPPESLAFPGQTAGPEVAPARAQVGGHDTSEPGTSRQLGPPLGLSNSAQSVCATHVIPTCAEGKCNYGPVATLGGLAVQRKVQAEARYSM